MWSSSERWRSISSKYPARVEVEDVSIAGGSRLGGAWEVAHGWLGVACEHAFSWLEGVCELTFGWFGGGSKGSESLGRMRLVFCCSRVSARALRLGFNTTVTGSRVFSEKETFIRSACFAGARPIASVSIEVVSFVSKGVRGFGPEGLIWFLFVEFIFVPTSTGVLT